MAPAWPLAMHYVSQERWTEAEPLIEMLARRASRRDPVEQLQIQITAGRVAQALGKLDRAIKAFTAATTLDRASLDAIRLLAGAYFEKADWENAFKNYQLLLVHHNDALDAEGLALCLRGSLQLLDLRPVALHLRGGGLELRDATL